MKTIPIKSSLAVALLGLSMPLMAQTSTIEEAIKQVNAQCPEDYPATITPLPDQDKIAQLKTATLMGMLESWNPALRATAAAELGRRGEQQIPTLRRGTESKNWTVRAGSAEALAAICRNMIADWKAYLPGDTNPTKVLEEMNKRLSMVATDFIRLTDDPKLEVRVAALAGLGTLQPQSAAAAQAVLKLCADDDNYLAQGAMIALDKRFSIKSLQQSEVIAAFKKTFETELPRGKGHIVRIISQMDEKAQRQFIPQLLDHLRWKPMRDTMFGAGGQQGAVEILTKLRAKELVPLLPDLMRKPMRGKGLFVPCVDSAKAFGRDAKAILPQLQTIHRKLGKEGKKSGYYGHSDIDQVTTRLKQTIDHLENL